MNYAAAAAAATSLQSCPTLCDPIDGSPPGSPVPGILQARTLEWVAISFSSAWKWKVKAKSLSRVQLLATPCTAAHQAPLSMGLSRQEYWSGVPLPSPSITIVCSILYLASASQCNISEIHPHVRMSSSLWISVLLCGYAGLFTQSSVDWHLDYFQFGGITDEVTMNIHEQVFMRTFVFISLR